MKRLLILFCLLLGFSTVKLDAQYITDAAGNRWGWQDMLGTWVSSNIWVGNIYWTNAPVIAGAGISISTSGGHSTISASGSGTAQTWNQQIGTNGSGISFIVSNIYLTNIIAYGPQTNFGPVLITNTYL